MLRLPGSLLYPCVHPLLTSASDKLRAKLDWLAPALAFTPEVLFPTVENYLGAPLEEATG